MPRSSGVRSACERDGGSETTIAGISILRFRDDGLVVEERGYWNVKPAAT